MNRYRNAVVIGLFLAGGVCWGAETKAEAAGGAEAAKLAIEKKAGAREIRDILGATHVIGRYCLTEKDFLNEGADQLLALGLRVIKVWFYAKHNEPPRIMYPYHSEWPDAKSLAEATELPYYKAMFEKPFTTYVLTVTSLGRDHDYWRTGITAEQEADETKQFCELAKALLTTYANTGKTFVLQHWEGDWMVRGHTDSGKDPEPAALENMVKWLNARQAGVTKARKEVGEKGVKVYHAAEVNKVFIAMRDGRPNMINQVIPKTNVDLVSYSSWDTMVDHREDPKIFREALDFIAKHTPDHPELGDRNVYVGEFGLPENDFSAEEQLKVIRDTVETSLDWGARYVIYWQLYCNEFKNPEAKPPVSKNEDGRGFWLIRPDGSKSLVWDYFQGLLKP